jgi:hypothetical protein
MEEGLVDVRPALVADGQASDPNGGRPRGCPSVPRLARRKQLQTNGDAVCAPANYSCACA